MPDRRRLTLLLASLLAAVPGVAPAAAAGAVDDAAGPRRPGPAYWLVGADGGVFAFGRARFAGSVSQLPAPNAVVAVAATATGDGYWVAGRDGGVFAFGDAAYLGGLAGTELGAPVADIAGTPSGGGYWLAGADGGVFAFGDAAYLGGLAGTALNQPITSITSTTTGGGYWLTGADGGVFAFGDARWLGGATTDAAPPAARVVDLAATPSGRGYWLASADGEVRAYGEASDLGSVGDQVGAPVVGIASAPSGHGYWVTDAAGQVVAIGDAEVYGSLDQAALQGPVVGIAAGLGRAVPTQEHRPLADRDFGWDISWPQCGGRFPGLGHRFAIVGVTDGRAYTVNPCLAEQHRWSQRHGSVGSLYVNVNYPPRRLDNGGLGLELAHRCEMQNLGCQLRAWGEEGAAAAFDAAEQQGVRAPMWWLDIETTNRWSADPVANALVIAGAIDALQRRGADVGIYSTPYQWRVIAGSYSPGLPTWVAGPSDLAGAASFCDRGTSFGGGPVWMVQFPYAGFDGNLMCRAGAPHGLRSFSVPPRPQVPEIRAVDPRAY